VKLAFEWFQNRRSFSLLGGTPPRDARDHRARTTSRFFGRPAIGESGDHHSSRRKCTRPTRAHFSGPSPVRRAACWWRWSSTSRNSLPSIRTKRAGTLIRDAAPPRQGLRQLQSQTIFVAAYVGDVGPPANAADPTRIKFPLPRAISPEIRCVQITTALHVDLHHVRGGGRPHLANSPYAPKPSLSRVRSPIFLALLEFEFLFGTRTIGQVTTQHECADAMFRLSSPAKAREGGRAVALDYDIVPPPAAISPRQSRSDSRTRSRLY